MEEINEILTERGLKDGDFENGIEWRKKVNLFRKWSGEDVYAF